MTTLLITPGDPSGIGPEVTWKSLRALGLPAHVRVVCIGASQPFDQMKVPWTPVTLDSTTGRLVFPQLQKRHRKTSFWILPAPTFTPPAKSGPLLLEGYQCGWAIEQAVHLIQMKEGHALVTGPIHKQRLQQGGYPYPGHTEFLARLSKAEDVTMMLANSKLRVSLVTTHVAIKEVSSCLSRAKILKTVEQTLEYLMVRLGIQSPRIGICGLNPHAGEGGVFGREDIDIIEPAIAEARKKWKEKAVLVGPLPADTAFAKHILAPRHLRFDAMVCMYHDQGLIPVKLLDFPNTVNITLGLPFIRTSVDHGVAFDIAGKGVADPSSMKSAIRMALAQLRKRRP